MQETYTYIARSTTDPLKVATFTLHDHSMSVGVGVPAEQIRATIEPESEPSASDGRQRIWLKPVALSMLDQASRPFELQDVAASLEDQSLQVTAWMRARGLRLAPVRLGWEQVDNPQAAQGFVEEIRRRKETSAPGGRFPGPLDYWWTWLLGAISLLGIGIGWIVRRERRSEAEVTSTG